MGLTSALYTGLSGLNANQFRIDVIGDNIANVNTTAFKGSRSVFQTQFSQTLSSGSPPTGTSGGTNPTQIGLGSVLGSIQRNFNPGSIETTGVPTDLAIEGDGFFIIQTPDGARQFTRDGAFKLSAANYLVTQDGSFIQGFGIDEEFNIIPGALRNLQIPVGSLSTARATDNVNFDGNLNAGGDVGTTGSILISTSDFRDGGAAGPAATAATLLTSLYDPADGATALFAAGDEVTMSNILKGEREVDEATFTVTATSTLADLLNWIQDKTALDTSAAQPNNPGWWISDGVYPPAAGTPGEQYYNDTGAVPAAGTIVFESNIGEDNQLRIGRNALVSTNADHASPFELTVPNNVAGDPYDATGESVYTSFVVYDSLGTEVTVDLTAVLEQKTSTGNTWRFFATSVDDTDTSRLLGTGTITFDTDGQFKAVTGNQITIDRDNTGAVTPLGVNLNFDTLSQFDNRDSFSTLVMTSQDGFAAGSLNSFSVGDTGVITGTFSNGLTRTLGQVALATFSNPEGLISKTNNNYSVGPNSGPAIITAPLSLGAGKILSGSLELSNVDLSREFIGLITATTGFSAASRVITTSNELLNELLLVAR
jgi:flagellar hook protein FlgE